METGAVSKTQRTVERPGGCSRVRYQALIAIDSRFLIAYHNERDAHHGAAISLMEDFLKGNWGQGMLLEYVFLEVVTVLLLRRNLEVASRVGRLLLDARELEFVPGSDLFVDAFRGFAAQSGTALSFTDSALVVLARARAEGRILTFDQEFRRMAGIRVYPGSN